MSNFHQLEVVGRVSDAQLQVGENLNSKTLRSNGLKSTTELNEPSGSAP